MESEISTQKMRRSNGGTFVIAGAEVSAGLQRGIASTRCVSASLLETTKDKLVVGLLRTGPDALLILNREGAIVLRAVDTAHMWVVPPQTAVLVRPNSEVVLQIAKGQHLIHFVGISLQSLDVGSPDVPEDSTSTAKPISIGPLFPKLRSAIERFDLAITGPSTSNDARLVSAALELFAWLTTEKDLFRLAVTSDDLPLPILELIESVRANPSAPWSLREASEMASYSAFHFSRLFKARIGYGFHEFVDRCRTEVAVGMLIDTRTPVEIVASSSGFGTAQGLRDSLRMYLKMTPTELRDRYVFVEDLR